MNKRGLSAVVTTLIIILLVIVAAGIIWVVVKAFIDRGSGDVELEQFNLNIQIKHAYIEGDLVKVGITRNKGTGDLTGVKFIFSDGSNSDGVERASSLDEFDTLSFVFDADDGVDIDNVIEVSVAPMYITSGKEKLGGVTDTADILNTVPGGIGEGVGGCGDDICSAGETCSSCEDDCGACTGDGESGTGTCPDGEVQNPNEDGVAEVCDEDDLDGQTCELQGFVNGGTLACNTDCLSFDTALCEGETPSSCDGTWDAQDVTDGNECDVVDHCIACVCETGFGPDLVAEDGTCIIDDPINTGEVNTVWNKIYMDSLTLPKDSQINDYTQYYVSFSTPIIASACFKITFADYLPESDISYLRLDDTIYTPLISATDPYSVWEAANCGL